MIHLANIMIVANGIKERKILEWVEQSDYNKAVKFWIKLGKIIENITYLNPFIWLF